MSEDTTSSYADQFLWAVQRIYEVLATPQSAWEEIATEQTSIGHIYTTYVIPLAAIGPFASILGSVIIGIRSSRWEPIASSIYVGMVSYGVALISVFLLSVIIYAIAPMYKGERKHLQAFKLAAYAHTPIWVVGMLYIHPKLVLPALLMSFYAVYLIYIGIPILMKVPDDEPVGFTGIITICTIILELGAFGISSASVTAVSREEQRAVPRRVVPAERAAPLQPVQRASPPPERPPVPAPRRAPSPPPVYQVPEIPPDITADMLRKPPPADER